MSLSGLGTIQDMGQQRLAELRAMMQALQAARDGTGATAPQAASATNLSEPSTDSTNPFANSVKIDLSVLITMVQPTSGSAYADGTNATAQPSAVSSTTQNTDNTTSSHSVGNDVAALLKAMASGDSQGTQAALQQLTTDLSASATAGHHRHHHHDGSAAAGSGTMASAQTVYQITSSFASGADGADESSPQATPTDAA